MSDKERKSEKAAAKVAPTPKSATPAPSKGLRRFTYDNELIYRPTKWPFEIVVDAGYIVQTSPFTDVGNFVDNGDIGGSYANSDDPDEENITERSTEATMFDTCEDALAFIHKRGDKFAAAEDGNVYPRVLKVRKSCIVEGVAFEPVIHEIEGNAKLEGVA